MTKHGVLRRIAVATCKFLTPAEAETFNHHIIPMRLFFILPLTGTALLVVAIIGILAWHILILPILGVALVVLIASCIWKLFTHNPNSPRKADWRTQ